MAGCRRCRPPSSNTARRNAASARPACWWRRRRCSNVIRSPSEIEVKDALGGVLCRCTGYRKIITAVMEAWRHDAATSHAGSAGDRAEAVGASPVRLDGVPKVTARKNSAATSFPADALSVLVVRSPHHRAAFAFGDLDAYRAQASGDRCGLHRGRYSREKLLRRHPALRRPAGAGGRFRALPRRGGGADRRRTRCGRRPRSRQTSRSNGTRCRTLLAAMRRCEGGRGAAACEPPRQYPDRGAWSSAAIRKRRWRTPCISSRARSRLPMSSMPISSPRPALPRMDGDTVVISACTQAPHMDRDDTALVLGLPPEKVRIVPTATGGGFGSKIDMSLQPLIGLVALKTGRPAALAYTRHESMISTTKRHPASMRATVGADADGQDRRHGLRRRFQHRGLCELRADGGEPRAGACVAGPI